MVEFWRSTALPHLEARRSCQENPCYRPHAHESFSVGAIDVGTSVLTGPLDGKTRLEPGDVIVIPAGQVHACNPDRGRWLYQMIHTDQAWAAPLAPHQEASRLFDGVRVFRRPELLTRLAPVMRRLRTDQSNPALTELAESVGMTKYQLIQAMRRATGLSPLAWRQNARVVMARQMLRDGQPIAETAHALGFTDQSHFHRVFRAHVAASPGSYRS